jgi:hypothetical protein
LNVNSTGAKPIYYRGAAITAGYLAAKRVYEFRYDGTNWELVGDINVNTTYSAATQSAAGLMTADDKKKLDAITASADSVSISRSLTSGTKIGTITINGTGTDLYCQTNTDTTYSNATTSAAGLMSAADKTNLNSAVSNISTYLTNCTTNTASFTTNGYVDTTDTNSWVQYYKVGIMTCVQFSLLTAKEIAKNAQINLIIGLPAANVAGIGHVYSAATGLSYPINMVANGTNLHTYTEHPAIPSGTRLIGEFWYRRTTL